MATSQGEVKAGDIVNIPPCFGFKQIYVREAYIKLLRRLLEIIPDLKGMPNYAIRVTGTPGMGKTYFMGFVWKELKNKFDMAVELLDGTTLVSSKDGALSEVKDVKSYLHENMIYLCDPGKYSTPSPHRVEDIVTILFASPSNSHRGNFSRTNLVNLYMPIWVLEELKDCVTKLYPSALESFDEQFRKWGGSIRSVTNFEAELETSREELLDVFTKQEELLHVINLISGDYVTPNVETFQWLVHRCVEGDDYGKFHLDFPSQYVKLKVAEAVRNLRVDWKLQADRLLMGRLYEANVLDKLLCISKEKDQEYLPVQPENSTISIPAIKFHQVYSSQTKFKKIACNTLYIPIESNRGGLDFVMPPWIFQTTIKKRHDAKEFTKLFEQFSSMNEKWNLVFIIPSCIKDEFTPIGIRKYGSSIECTLKLLFDFN